MNAKIRWGRIMAVSFLLGFIITMLILSFRVDRNGGNKDEVKPKVVYNVSESESLTDKVNGNNAEIAQLREEIEMMASEIVELQLQINEGKGACDCWSIHVPEP